MSKTSLVQWLATVFSKAVTKMMVVFDGDRDTFDIPPPTPVFIVGTIKSTGEGQLNNSSGQIPTVEASSSSSNAYLYTGLFFQAAANPTVAPSHASSVYAAQEKRRVGRAQITVDGAGAAVNQSLVAALAGYYGVLEIKSVKVNATIVAGATLTFESPAGTAALPSLETQPAYTANVRRDDVMGLVITHAALTDNQAIVVDLAGWGALSVVDIEYEYWWET